MISSAALHVALAGLGFGLSLIVVVGPQNAFLLRVGVLGRGVVAVVVVCTLADVALIAAGTAGAGAAIRNAHWVLTVVRWGGAAFLLTYAALAARRAWRDTATTAATAGTDAASPGNGGLRTIVLTALALTFLNPGVYLDTVVLLGSVANAHGGRQWWFATGAAVASALWFSAIGFGARRLGRRFDRPSTWRVLDAFVTVVMTVTAVRLVLQ